jgi:membrane-associated phospholipid phosphatase
MHPDIRSSWVFAALWVVLGATLALGLLTLLHAHLGDPSVARFDHGIQFAVHGWATPGLTRLMRALTWVGSIKIFGSVLAVVVAVLLGQRRRHAAALLGFGMVGALALNETLKVHFHRARPMVPWSIGDEHTFSFPSGHSLFSVVLYGTVAYLVARRTACLPLRVAVVALAAGMPLAIGLSRIYLGMHYPTDVLAGYTVGVVWLGVVAGADREWRGMRKGG